MVERNHLCNFEREHNVFPSHSSFLAFKAPACQMDVIILQNKLCLTVFFPRSFKGRLLCYPLSATCIYRPLCIFSSILVQGFFSGVSGAVIRPLSQWEMPTFFPNLNKKIPNQKVIFFVNQYSLQIAFIFNGLLIKIKHMIRNKSDSMQFKRPCLRKYYKR